MPTKAHAATYAAVTHFLKAVQASGSDAAEPVNAAMRSTPVDFFGRPGSIRPDGRVVFDLPLYRVKHPSESHYPWDYYAEERAISVANAYRPLDAAGCPLAGGSAPVR